MRLLAIAAGLLATCSLAFCQLTTQQKIDDFQYLAGLYAKNYVPYEWKRDTQNFDLLNIGPWLDKITAAQTDLDFYDVMSQYVSSLNDAHDTYQLPSTFTAYLHFIVDLYDGKAIIESIDRDRLPAAEFPFEIGDELVSIDGKPVDDLIDQLSRYDVAANPRSTRRFAANLLTVRPQALIPHAVDLAPFAAVTITRRIGKTETFNVPWAKTGLPLLNDGPVPSPKMKADARTAGEQDDYLAPLRDLLNCQLPQSKVMAVRGFGAVTPIFKMPSNFTQRLGTRSTDQFFSGTFQSGGFRIGFIRIPSYAPSNLNNALSQFATEIAFMQANTDGLIIDEMRNPGGSVSYVNVLLQYLMPKGFRAIGFELRATSNWVASISSSVESAKAQGAPQYIINLLLAIYDAIHQANSENRGRTGPIPLDDITLDRDPVTDSKGNVLAYTRPIMLMVDELSASGADMFPATFQDNARGIIFGMRTMGAGGNVVGYNAGPYSEGFTSLTQSLMVRKNTMKVDDFPETAYVENVGVRPDIVQDYMTKDNLLQDGAPFVKAFTDAMVNYLRQSRPTVEVSNDNP